MQDCPDGNYASLERSGKKQRSKPWRELYNGFTNYRMWGLAACYAYTFGVEVGNPLHGLPQLPPPSLCSGLVVRLLCSCRALQSILACCSLLSKG